MATASLAATSKVMAAAACATPLGTDQASRTSAVQTAYQTWKTTYVMTSGAGGDLRVQRSGFDGYDTVSEGIAYGMLFAAYNNDKPTFDGLWAYAQKHVNGNGVMNWRIAADGTTTGYNGATDADEDIAIALIAADTTWGGYRGAAIKQINTVKQYQIEANSFVIKPGDVWGGSNLLNPSYISPSYYDVFERYSGDTTWAKVKTANYRVLQSAQNGSTGLFPDWSTATGLATNGMSHNYGYDASRIPLRLALSATWSCDQTAAGLLAPMSTWFAGQNLRQLASSYTLEGSALDQGDSMPLMASAAAAAMVSQDEPSRSSSWNALLNTTGNSYYPASMRLFGLMVASGTMISPLSLPAQTGAVPATAVSTTPAPFAIMGSNTNMTVNSTNDLQVSVSAPAQRNDMIVDLELYDMSGRRLAQQVYEHQTLGSIASTFSVRWNALVSGEYVLKTGIFRADWSENLAWNDRAGVVTVTTPLVSQPIIQPVVTAPEPSPVVSPTQPVVTAPVTPIAANLLQPASANLSIWWPGGAQAVSGVQPFKAVIDGAELSQYDMYWQVDGGQLNRMDSVQDGAPHKLSLVDLHYWRWSGDGRYTVTFVAKNSSGAIIAQKSVVITVR